MYFLFVYTNMIDISVMILRIDYISLCIIVPCQYEVNNYGSDIENKDKHIKMKRKNNIIVFTF